MPICECRVLGVRRVTYTHAGAELICEYRVLAVQFDASRTRVWSISIKNT